MRPVNLSRLHFLNTLFAPLTGHDLYLAEQIDAAIATSLEEANAKPPSEPDFIAAATRLFARLCPDGAPHGFFHWDAGTDQTGAAPLFARATLLDGLKRLAAFPESTLLITNLRSAHCPPSRRWSPRRQREYDDTLSLISNLAANRTRRHARLNLLFL